MANYEIPESILKYEAKRACIDEALRHFGIRRARNGYVTLSAAGIIEVHLDEDYKRLNGKIMVASKDGEFSMEFDREYLESLGRHIITAPRITASAEESNGESIGQPQAV